jgi:hypothetical protein
MRAVSARARRGSAEREKEVELRLRRQRELDRVVNDVRNKSDTSSRE